MIVGVDARELQGRATGTGRYLRNLLRLWSQEGSDTLVAYFNGPAPADPVLAPPIVVRPLGDAPTRGLRWQQRVLPQAAARDALDVFFSPAYTCPLRLRVPRVTTVHDLSFFALPHEFGLLDGLKRRVLVQASVRASSRVLVQSDFTRRELLAWFPESAGRLRVVSLGPDDDLPEGASRAEARARLGISGPLVLTVGSIFNRRRLPELLRATAEVARRHSGLRLEVVGENRTHPFLDIHALVRRLDLGDRVRISGYLPDAELADRYAAADVAVFLSDYEGFGLGVLEAMARGVPVVASERPAMGELFGSGAVLVDPADPGGVAAAIARVLGDAALRDDLVQRGRSLARTFSWRKAALETRAALQEAAGQSEVERHGAERRGAE
jgi:glycosyltransferase involved in cell wall biosynthesis